jgi:N-glycosylase/DNA lyase
MKKKNSKISPQELEPLYAAKKKAIRQRLAEFNNVPPGEYFYECVYCLLTPQSSAVNAAKAVDLLRKCNFWTSVINPEPLLHQKDFYIRFHRTKAKHLVHTKEQYSAIQEQLTNGSGSPELREWLVKNVKGMGWKEASHFMRNIGHRDLAILDRHILKNLLRLGVLRSLPKTLTPKVYLSIEKKFKKFSQKIGIPMDELDLLFWSMETGEILK